MKRFLIAITLACVLSGTALAGDMPAVGQSPAPGETSGPSSEPGDMGNGGNQGSGNLAALLSQILDLVF